MASTNEPDASTTQAASPELARLDVLVGTWETRGHTVARPSEPAVEIIGTDAYEWLGGGFFIVHRVDVRVGDVHVEAIELIGAYEEATETYAMRAFDSQGSYTTMQASVDADGVWTFANDAARATLTVGAGGTTMTAKWERSDGAGVWSPWMDVHFTKSP